MSAETALLRENQIMLHALAHLMVRKGVFTQEEYGAAHDWFKDAFTRLALASAEMAYQDPPPKLPSTKVQKIIAEIQTKLFEGPCPSSATTAAKPVDIDSNSCTNPPTK